MALSAAENAAQIVFQGGRSIPLSALALQGDKLVVKTTGDGFTIGQILPLASADHVYGDKPAAVNQGVAQLLMGKPKEAQKLLESVLNEHRASAKISGNFWLEAARALLVVNAVNGDTAACSALGKEISDATPEPGVDAFVALGKALLLPVSVPLDDRLLALRDLLADNRPADVRAYASYFCASLCKKENRNPDALEAYLTVPCVVPTGGLILNAAAEIQAAELLATLGRRDEAAVLFKTALRDAPGTILVDEVHKRLDSLK